MCATFVHQRFYKQISWCIKLLYNSDQPVFTPCHLSSILLRTIIFFPHTNIFLFVFFKEKKGFKLINETRHVRRSTAQDKQSQWKTNDKKWITIENWVTGSWGFHTGLSVHNLKTKFWRFGTSAEDLEFLLHKEEWRVGGGFTVCSLCLVGHHCKFIIPSYLKWIQMLHFVLICAVARSLIFWKIVI